MTRLEAQSQLNLLLEMVEVARKNGGLKQADTEWALAEVAALTKVLDAA